ncbi:MAG: AraC family transcriptional regulator [Stenotrophomonas sp.]|uniref:Transcriptional regulator, AraC family n=2 Tax=Comamonadaceae TaxID=80864 RepID=A0A1G9UR48_9BURK|nr:AraC family transcriptional regulator [Oryzisolibacter propanilivorax]SDM62025.1 transcriptional regulator, AraC family [Oryzisolibacter propanilivorax]
MSSAIGTSDILVSQLVTNVPEMALGQGRCGKVCKLPLQDGVEIVRWAGHFEQPVELPLYDDSERISFSFNCNLAGQADCLFEDGVHHRIEDKAGRISYSPGRRGIYRQQGALENLSVMVRPDVFLTWMGQPDSELRNLLARGGYASWHRGGELLATAQWLNRMLAEMDASHASLRHSLWFQGQAMSLIGLFLESRGSDTEPDSSKASDRRLMRARDRLLSDLSQAPALAELARVASMSEPSLTRGFRRLFGNSPHGLFQVERMNAARLRLLQGQVSVSVVAAELGYTNMSHFAEAFRRQFAILPSEVRLCTSGSSGSTRDPGRDG